MHRILISVSTLWTFKDKFSSIIFDNLYLTIVSTAFTKIGFRIQFRIQNCIVNMSEYRDDRFCILLKIRYFNIGDSTSRRKFLESSFLCQLIESIDILSHADMV